MTSAAINQHSQNSTKWSLRDAFHVCLAIALLIVGFNALLIAINAQALFANSTHKGLWTLGLFTIQNIAFLVPLYILVMRKYGVGLSALGFRKMPVKEAITWTLKAISLVFLINAVLAFVILPNTNDLPGFSPQAPFLPLFGDGALNLGIAVLVLVIIAPIVEELIFRGFLLQTFLARFSATASSLITATLFAALHFEFQSIGIMLILALILNWLFIRTRSLVPCIAFHIFNNGVAFLLEWLVQSGRL